MDPDRLLLTVAYKALGSADEYEAPLSVAVAPEADSFAANAEPE
jgi:hypothetical protein